jgi:hypothetical protein
MCCLRYEHEFYVQSRKRFPKEGKVITTARGEEKVMAIDIFRENLTLRAAEGEPRVLSLGDFNREMAALRGESAIETEADETESDTFDDVSPELLYVSESETILSETSIVVEPPTPAGPPDVVNGADEAANRRRRGRRGGRRSRGGDSGEK